METTLCAEYAKLAICTYRLPDDPRALEDKVVHLRKKLFACVV